MRLELYTASPKEHLRAPPPREGGRLVIEAIGIAVEAAGAFCFVCATALTANWPARPGTANPIRLARAPFARHPLATLSTASAATSPPRATTNTSPPLATTSANPPRTHTRSKEQKRPKAICVGTWPANGRAAEGDRHPPEAVRHIFFGSGLHRERLEATTRGGGGGGVGRGGGGAPRGGGGGGGAWAWRAAQRLVAGSSWLVASASLAVWWLCLT